MRTIISDEMHDIAVNAAWEILNKNIHHYDATMEAVLEAASKGKLTTLVEVYDETIADALFTILKNSFFGVERTDIITLDSDMFQIENSKTIQLKIEW